MTTHLKDAIADMRVRHMAPGKLPLEPAILRAALRLPDGLADLKPPKDFDAIAVTLAETLRRGRRLTVRQARDGAWCLWETKTAIASDPHTLEPFLQQLRELRHKGASRALALSYLISFHQNRPGLSAVAAALCDLAAAMGAPFDALQTTFRLFDLEQGPLRIGQAALNARKSPSVFLRESGLLFEQALAGGFVEPCARRVLELAAGDTRLPPAERLEFIEMISVRSGTRELNFPQHMPLVTNALLLPYRGREVEKPIKDRTLNFLVSLERLGDPRSKSGNWNAMPGAREVAIAWLTEQALRQFLDVVGAVNPNENWKYRRRFWEAMYNHHAISEAWVVLDAEGVKDAHRRFGKNASFGRFTSGGGVLTGHAVLLLKMGAGICAEWSYNGKCRFWADASRDGAPKLYGPHYDAEVLRTGRRYAPVEEIVHSPHTGDNAWQHKAARRIHSMTGIRVPAREYML
jgi:hypothetical protein